MFWATCDCMLVFANWLARVENYAQPCPCHSRQVREFFQMDNSCPQRGCRAPDFAVGHFKTFAESLARESYQDVIALNANPDLTVEQHASLLDSFEFARRNIQAEFQIRMHGWLGLPARAFGMGHQDPELVQECLLMCLVMYETFTTEDH